MSMKPIYSKSKQDPDERYCVRCGITEKDVRKYGTAGCRVMGGYYPRHSYTTDRELDEWEAGHDKQ